MTRTNPLNLPKFKFPKDKPELIKEKPKHQKPAPGTKDETNSPRPVARSYVESKGKGKPLATE